MGLEYFSNGVGVLEEWGSSSLVRGLEHVSNGIVVL